MKRRKSLILVMMAVSCLCIACASEGVKEDSSETNVGKEGKTEWVWESRETEYKVEDDTLWVTGGTTMEMDEVWQIWKYQRPRFLSISPGIRDVVPLGRKAKEEQDENFFNMERVTLQGNSLSYKALSCLLSEIRFCTVIYWGAEDGEEKIYEVSPIGRHEPLYKTYLKDVRKQNDMYIWEGILFTYEGTQKDIKIPKTVSEIADEAFLGEKMDVELETVVFPDSVESIGERAFAAQKLRKIVLGEQTREIGVKAFGDCELEQVLRIPAAVESIGEEAFGVVKEVVFEGKTTKYSREMCKPGEETRYVFEQGAAESFTNIWASSFVHIDEKKNRLTISVSWVPVGNVDGYDVCVNAGCDYDGRIGDDYAKVIEVPSEKGYAEVTVPTLPDFMRLHGGQVGIKIRPYRKEKDYKVYGDSAKCMCGDQDEEEYEDEEWRDVNVLGSD